MGRGKYAKETLSLPDGREVPVALKLRYGIYRVRYHHPDGSGRWAELSTGQTTERDAWREAGRIVLREYTQAGLRPTARTLTWDAALEAISSHGTRRTLRLRQSTLDLYAQAVANLKKTITTKGPGDVTPETARRFATLFAATPYARSPRPGAKTYIRSAKTVDNAIHFLSCLWSALEALKLATSNPFADCPRPEVVAKAPRVASEDDFRNFFSWLDAMGWELMSVFFRIKALAGCRTLDLASLLTRQFDPAARALTIAAGQDKTHRERVIPIPAYLAARLDRLKGEQFLWGRYSESLRAHTNDVRVKDGYDAERLKFAVRRVLDGYADAFPARPRITPHDFRRRAITLTVIACGGSVDAAAEVLQVSPAVARKHYLDRERLVNRDSVMKKMAGVLLPDG